MTVCVRVRRIEYQEYPVPVLPAGITERRERGARFSKTLPLILYSSVFADFRRQTSATAVLLRALFGGFLFSSFVCGVGVFSPQRQQQAAAAYSSRVEEKKKQTHFCLNASNSK